MLMVVAMPTEQPVAMMSTPLRRQDDGISTILYKQAELTKVGLSGPLSLLMR